MGPSLQGVLELNALFALAGIGMLAAVRGFASLLDLLELLGLALILGLCAVTLLATLVLVAGGGLSTATILGLVAGVTGAGGLVAALRRRPLPRRLGSLPPPTFGTLFAALAAAAVVAVLVALFRLVLVTPIEGADSWEFWVPKAKVIYFNGGIGDPFFVHLASPSYPLLVPALQAMDFRFMGFANAPELAVQYWFLYAAFVFATAALLRRLARPWLAWLFVASTAVIPALDNRVIGSQADWALDILFALSAILAVAWLRTRAAWQLWCFGLLLASVIATKREGQLLAACLGLAIAASSLREWRRVWPRLLGAGAAAYAVNLPWREWWRARHLATDLPGGGLHVEWLASHLSGLWPAFDKVVHPLFATHEWLVFAPLALVAGVICLTLPGVARKLGVLYLTLFVLAVSGFTWVAWTDPTGMLGSVDPLPRLAGSLVLVSTVLTPLLVDPLLAPLARTVPDQSAPRHADARARA